MSEPTVSDSLSRLPCAVRGFVGHTESLGLTFGGLGSTLLAHPAVDPDGWGSAYDGDPWRRPLPADLPQSTRGRLRQHYLAQRPDRARSLTVITRTSGSQISLEDHDGALVLAIAYAPAPTLLPARPPELSPQRAPDLPAEVPADVRAVVGGLPFAVAATLQAQLLAADPGPRMPGDRVTALLGLAAVWHDDARLAATLRQIAHLKPGDWALRAAGIAVARQKGDPRLLYELYEAESDPELRAELAALTADGSPRPAAAAAEPADALDSTDPAALQQRAAAALGAGDLAAAGALIDRALELTPLAGPAYFLRAQLGAAAGRVWPALLDATLALAVARRQGVHLQAMQQLQTALRDQLLAAPTPPTAAVELQAVAQLGLLLRSGRLHEVEEIAQALLPLPGRAPLWWLAIGLARWERGRPERAIEALQAALHAEPQLLAARFLLGECRRAVGDIAGALDDFDQLDPQPGERPPRPSLLAAYADELLGTQAPWEAREHAFARMQLLREHGHPEAALAVLNQLLQREPAAADALLAQGILLVELLQPAAALAVLDQARAALLPAERLLADEDPLGILHLQRAYALVALGDPDGAAAALHLALGLSPERAPAMVADPVLAALHVPVARLPGHAALRRIAHDLRQPDFAADPDASAGRASDSGDAAVARLALRAQLAELLIAALLALDQDADAAARHALLHHAGRGLSALAQLAPAVVRADVVRPMLDATARALGIPAVEFV